MSTKRFLLIAALFCSFGAANLRAQGVLTFPEWLEVGSLGDWSPSNYVPPYSYTALFFFDPVHGVAARNGPKIYFISNPSEGLWHTAVIPSGVSLIREIRFIQGKLYAASEGTDVLISTDSGQSWKYSGLNLNNANDIYADANGNIRILTDPMTRFARIDTMDCVATGNGSIFRSSDGGLNWSSVVTGNDPISTGVFGDPCEHVFIAPYSWGTECLRSTDSGQTWIPVHTGASAYPEFIYGASTVCYVTDTGGIFRSIDDGITWASITSIDSASGPYNPMFVFGPMGEHVVMPWTLWDPLYNEWLDEPWMTSTGGDGNLHSAVAMTDSNGAPLENEDTMNVPFRVVSMCNSFSIPIALEADVPGLSVKATLTNNSGGDVTLLSADSIYYSEPVLNQRIVQDTMWLAYDPHHLVDTALITFENHWNCSVWTETLLVIVTSIPTATIAPPPVFAGNCQPVSQAAFVMLDSCTTLVIDFVEIPPALASRLSPTNPLPDTLKPGASDALFFTFDPADTVGTISDSILIFAHYYPSAGLDSTLNYFNFNALYNGDSDYSAFEQSIPVILTASPSPPWALYPSAPDSAAPGTDITFRIIQSPTLPSNVTKLDFTLTYNDDLLSFVRSEEPSVDTIGYVRTPDGLAHVTFQVSPVGSDSVVATLHFLPYVTRATQTAIVLTNPTLTNTLGGTESCIDSIITGQTLFTLIPVCGSGELAEFLRSGTVVIDNIQPNPATSSIAVGVSSAGSSTIPAELFIVDELGRTVYQQKVLLSHGEENRFQVNIENLPSGIYAVQLRASGLASTREFIKQ